jgi:hypothetical protein
MANALDLFRAQHEAAQEIQARLQEIETTLSHVRGDVDRLVHDKAFLALLQQEQNWLAAAQRTVIEVRAWREQERLRYWPGLAWRWMVALALAIASAAAAGAAYGWATAPHAAELATLRPRAEFAAFVEHRIMTRLRRSADSSMG